MSGILVVAGSDVSMSDLDGGAVSTRIDLNLNLAPPWSPDFLGLGSGSGDDLRVDDSQGYASRRILPRFGPGIHGVFLDLHHDYESQPDQSAFAQVRGVSPFSSSPSHEQVIPSLHPLQTQSIYPPPTVATPAFSQETVEQLHEDAENGLRFGRNSEENHLLNSPVRHGFRRYTRPLTAIQVERLVDAIKDRDAKEGSFSEKEGETSSAGNFECNVCLDMAVDPVLTSCGHLFCWPCLFRWLYIHSEDEECPVCKGAVTESDIVPIYGRGSKSARASQSTADESDFVPPRPHAHRSESLRQRFGGWVRGWEWEGDRMGEVETEDPRRLMLRSNEVLRMRRAFHFLQENIQGTLHTRVRTRRRMAERRERFRTPTAEATSNGVLHHAVGGIHEVLQRRVARLSEHLQEDVVRRLATNRTQADRLASIRARISNLAASEDSHQTVLAAISVSGQDDIVIPPVSSNLSSSQIAHGALGISIPEEASSIQHLDITRQTNEATGDQFLGQERLGMFMTHTSEALSSRSSGYADVGAESSHGRKRRRLN
ncbi:hypothetical protein O6H91_10G050900 [Diphasiastrum complanatum]|uniref:Uncharacterized protein n=1 Tax=Diphasiastrum complanatum TaxID=34168 RepID=A0ACC2CH22_DIPCM|nr:hypothetical protein O6H91_10G050900 [Diphasiastrum complanatum]